MAGIRLETQARGWPQRLSDTKLGFNLYPGNGRATNEFEEESPNVQICNLEIWLEL